MHTMILTVSVLIFSSASCLNANNELRDILTDGNSEKISSYAATLDESQLRIALKMIEKDFKQAQTTWQDYKCSNLFSCDKDALTFNLAIRVPEHFGLYAIALLETAALVAYAKYRTFYAPAVLSLIAFLLAAGTTSCKELCPLLDNRNTSRKVIENVLIAKITCLLQDNQ